MKKKHAVQVRLLRTLGIVLGFALVIAVVAYVWLAAKDSDLPKRGVRHQTSKPDLQAWPLLPKPALPKYGVPLQVPDISAFPLPAPGEKLPFNKYNFLVVGSAWHERFVNRAKEILAPATDPDLVLLREAIEAKNLFLRFFFTRSTDNFAAFRLFPTSDVASNEDLPLVSYQAELALNLNYISKLRKPDSIRHFFWIVRHEFHHYLQYLEVREKPNEQWRDFVLDARRQKLDEAICRLRWGREEEAYWFAAKKSVEWGLHLSNNEYVNDRRAFDQFIFTHIGQGYLSMHPECAEFWADEAGHPNPEAFAR